MSTLLEEQPVIKETNEESHFTHIVNPPNNLHIWVPGMEIQEMVNIAKRKELPLKALCGFVFVPKNDPEKYPACPECISVAGDLMRSAGE